MVHFQCVNCQTVLCVKDAAEARRAPCPECGHLILPPETVPPRPQRPRHPLPPLHRSSPRKPLTAHRLIIAPATVDRPPPEPEPEPLRPATVELPPEPAPPPPPALPPSVALPASAPSPAPPAPSALPSRFPAVPYRPEGGFHFGGFLRLFGTMMLGAVLLGWLTSFVGQWYYVVLLFPLLMGIGLAFIGFYAVHVSKTRSPLLAGFAGLVSGALAVASMHFCDYLQLRKDMKDPSAAIPLPMRLAQMERPGFATYMVTAAQLGFEVSAGDQAGFHVGAQETWGYWAVELVLVCATAVIATRSEASAPFCGECGQWKEERLLGRLRGQMGEVLQACRRGQLGALNEHGIADGKGELAVSAWVCPRCALSAPVDVQLEQTSHSSRRTGTPEILHLTYPGEALPVLEDFFNHRAA